MTRQRIIVTTLSVVIVVILLLGLGGYLALTSSRFAQYAISQIDEIAGSSLGARVQIRHLQLHPWQLRVEARGVVVHGTEPNSATPLLTVDRIEITAKVLSLLRRDVGLKEIVVDHPVVHLVQSKDGVSNLPTPPPSQGKSSVQPFDLGIEHVAVSGGEVYFDNRQSALDADLHDLRAEVRFDSAASAYQGSASYRDGHLRTGNSAIIPHNLDTAFTLSRLSFAVHPATISLGSSTVQLEATLSDFSNPALKASYNGQVAGVDLQHLLNDPSLPSGEVLLTGEVQYQNGSQPFMKSVVVNGDLRSNQLLLRTPQMQLVANSVHANYRMANGNLLVDNARAGVLGGTLAAQFSMADLDATPEAKLHATLRSLSLQSVQQAVRSAHSTLQLAGSIDGTAQASWKGSLEHLRAQSDLTMKSSIQQQATSSRSVPVNAAIHVNYDKDRDEFGFHDTFLHTAASTVNVQGTVARNSDLRLQAQTANLREIVEIAAALTPSSSATSLPNISGPATLDARVSGSTSNPRIDGRFDARSLQVQSSAIQTAHIEFSASPSEASINRGSLVASPTGQVALSGRVELSNWKCSSSSPIEGHIQVQQMPIRQLQQVANVDYPVSGNLSADFSVKGTQDHPQAEGNAHLTDARAYGQTLRDVALAVRTEGDALHSTLDLSAAPGAVHGQLTFYPNTKQYEVQMQIPSLELGKLDAVAQRNLEIAGTLIGSASGKGSLDDPQLDAQLHIPELRLRQGTIKQMGAKLRIANHQADVNLDSQLLGSYIQGRGTTKLSGDYYTEASLDTKGLALAPLLSLYKPMPPDFQGQMELHASLKGPAKDKSRLEAHLLIPTLQASYQQIQLQNSGPLRADFANSIITVQPSEITGTGSHLKLQGTVPFKAGAAPSLTAEGQIDMQLAKLLDPGLQGKGAIVLDVHSTGNTASELGAQGQIRLQDVTLTSESLPNGLQHLNGTLDLTPTSVRVVQLTGESGGGQLTAGGTVTYRPQVDLNLNVNARDVRLRYPQGLRALLSGDLSLSGNTQAALINGRVLINSIGFTEDFDLASFAGQFGEGQATAPPEGVTQNIKLDVAVQSSNDLTAANPEISLQGQANLRVVGTVAEPVILGRTDLTGGDLFFRNQRYTLQRGIITFANPNETQPVLNVEIGTVVQQYNLTLSFIGPIDRLRTTYTSDPPLPPVDVINLLVRGQTTEEASPGNLDANSVLAEGLAGQVSSRVQKFAGLSSLQIDPTLGGNGTDPGARIAIQQRVTRNFIFTFSHDVTNPQADIVQGEYQISRRWSVQASRDQYGSVNVGGKFTKTF